MADKMADNDASNNAATVSKEPAPPPYSGPEEPQLKPPPYSGPGGPPLQQAVYPPAPQMEPGRTTTTTIVTNQPLPAGATIVMPIAFGPQPMNMTCPRCQAIIVTSITPQVGIVTWVVCGGIALSGCWCGCCFIPFCVDSLQDCQHSCPNCNNVIGVYRRM